jgi:hypothetical protein
VPVVTASTAESKRTRREWRLFSLSHLSSLSLGLFARNLSSQYSTEWEWIPASPGQSSRLVSLERAREGAVKCRCGCLMMSGWEKTAFLITLTSFYSRFNILSVFNYLLTFLYLTTHFIKI